MKKLSCFSDDHWVVIRGIADKLNEAIDLVNSQQEAIEKLEKVITRETVRIATDDIIDALSGSEEPIERVSKARYAEKLGIHDTHRTVTLRIPKGMTFVEALFYADLSLNMSDNQAKKALDEVEK